MRIFDAAFDGVPCSSLYTDPRPSRDTYINSKVAKHCVSIMNEPEDMLTNPIVSFDPHHWAHEVLKLASADPCPRFKSFLATVRGMGGGKTRALEEIWWSLLGRPGVLPLAITFNCTMEISGDDFRWSANARVCYALSVVSRLASVLYGLPMRDVVRKMRATAPWDNGQIDAYPKHLIRGFLKHAAKKVGGPGTSTVVVLVDEVVKSEDEFAPLLKILWANADVTSTLRSALLDTKIGALHVGLVISSLTISPIGETVAGRAAEPLALKHLEPAEIVSTWRRRGAAADVSTLHYLAATLCSLPRLAQFANEYLQEHTAERVKVVELFEHVREMVHIRYQPVLPSRSELRAAFYGERVVLTDEVADMIQVGMYTNSMTAFLKDGKSLKIVPEVSLLMLAASARGSNEVHGKLLCALFEFLLTDEVLPPERKGDVLEKCTLWLLKMRLTLVAGEGEKNFLFSEILGLHGLCRRSSSLFLKVLLKIHVNVVSLDQIVQSRQLTSSYKNVPALITDLQHICMAPGEIYLFKAPEKESFDLMLAACDPVDGPYVVFIDCKSRQLEGGGDVPAPAAHTYAAGHNETHTSAGRKETRTSAGYKETRTSAGHNERFKQAMHVANKLVPAAARAAPGREGSLAQALGTQRYVYLYLTSRPGESLVQEDGRIVELRGSDSKAFFGPLWDVYRTARGLSS